MERQRQTAFSVTSTLGLILALGSASALFGQIGDRAIVTGLVTDASGAAIPDAQVTFTNEATGAKTAVGTNTAGNYSSTDLLLGTYTIQVGKEGFKTYVRSGVTLTGGENYRQDVQLELGTVTQEIKVTAATAMIQSETATVSHTIGQSYYENLPAVMGADIRLAESLLQVQPGYIPVAPNGDAIFRGSQFQSRINGGQNMATENWFDGAAFGYAEGHQQTQESSLPYSSVKEMTVVENTFSAQYGHTSGGFIQYTTKSGTNQLHGQLYDYYTSGHFDARNFFLPNVLPLTQDNWGFDVGGPVVIPKVYNGRNKTFFFFNEDALDYRSTVNIGYVNTLPLAAQRNGDFSGLLGGPLMDCTSKPCQPIVDARGRPMYQGEIYNPTVVQTVNGVAVRNGYGFDPTTGLPIAGAANIIPANDPLRSQIAAKYVPLIPGANRDTLSQNEFGGTSDDNNQIDVRTWLGRVDHTFNDKFSMSDSFYANRRPRIAHCGGPGGCDTQHNAETDFSANDTYIGQGFDQTITNRFEHLQFDWVLKPNLLNHTTLAYDRWHMKGHSLSGGVGWPSLLGIKGLLDNTAGPPSVNFSGGQIGYTSYGTPWLTDGSDINNRYQVLDDLTWITGRHTVKAGFEFRYMQFPQEGWAVNTGGSFTFSSNETGGVTSSGLVLPQTGDPFASMLLGQVDSAGFSIPLFYRPSQKYFAPWVNDEIKVTPRLTLTLGGRVDGLTGLYEQFNRFSNFSETAPNPGAGGIPGAMVFAGSGPGRTGQSSFAKTNWNFGPRVGIAYRLNDKTALRGGYGIYYAGVPAGLFNSFPVDGFQTNPSVFNTTNGLTPTFYWDNGFPQSAVQIPPVISPSVDNGVKPNAVTPDEETMPRYQNWSFSVERQLTTNMSIDVAYVGNHGTRLIAGSTFAGIDSNMNNPSVLALGASLLSSPADSTAAQAAGIKLPYAGFTGDVAQALRPWPQYQTIDWRNVPVGTSHYNALQVLLQKRMSAGLQFRVAYTWSKLINDGADAGQGGGGPGNGIQNPINIQQGERSVSADDVPQYLGAAWVYDLPFGKGKRYGSGVGGALDKLIGGWQLSSTQVYQSGRPLLIGMNCDFCGFLFSYNKRPDKVGPGWNTAATNPQDAYLLSTGFADPGALQFGNEPRTDPHLRWTPFLNEDFGILKDTHFSEAGFVRFEADMGNVFNRVDFCPPNQNWSVPQTTVNGVTTGFGTTGSQCNIPRRIQFGLTINF